MTQSSINNVSVYQGIMPNNSILLEHLQLHNALQHWLHLMALRNAKQLYNCPLVAPLIPLVAIWHF